MFFLTALVLNACGSSQTMALNSVQLTNQLQPGMTYDEVVAILGSPKSSKTINGDWIVRWNLQEMWKGYVPYDFVFSTRDKTLMQSFAGYYYNYSAVGGGQTGGTERKVMLCPNGRYQKNSESG